MTQYWTLQPDLQYIVYSGDAPVDTDAPGQGDGEALLLGLSTVVSFWAERPFELEFELRLRSDLIPRKVGTTGRRISWDLGRFALFFKAMRCRF